LRTKYYTVRFLELAITFASCYLAVGSFFHSFIYTLIKQFVSAQLARLDISYTLTMVDPDVILPQLISVLVFIVALYYWLFGSRSNVLSIYSFNIALFLPEALTFSQLDWLNLFYVPELFLTDRSFSNLLITGLVIVAGYIVLLMTNRFLEIKTATERRGAQSEEADLVFVNQSTIALIMIAVSLVVVFGASFMVPMIKAQVHGLLQTQVYRYILLGIISSIIISASLIVFYREQIGE
jgi:hypothetical protein